MDEQTQNGNLILEPVIKVQMGSGCIYFSFNLRGGLFLRCQGHAPAA